MPLKVLLAAIGSSGDVHPILGLAQGLKARGHRVTVATNEFFEEQVASNGLEFIALGTRDEATTLMHDPRLWTVRRGIESIAEGAVVPNIGRLYEIIHANRGPSTIVVASTLCLGARLAQEKLGIPTASVHFQPLAFRSLVDNGQFGRLNLGPGIPRTAKRALFWLIDRLWVDRMIAPELNRVRARVGLDPVSRIFGDYMHSPDLTLGLFPDWFASPQPDWPKQTHVTGFVLHDEGGRTPLNAEAEEFLRAGSAPILVTPGSAATDRREFFLAAVRACAEAGARAMLVTNHPAQLPANLPEGIRGFAYLPFGEVLPRCRAIVYHGGIGTLAQAIRAAVPQLIAPNAHDQPDNGRRIERLGLGISLPPGRPGPERLARTLGALIRSDAIRSRCREFAPRVDPAASLEKACGLIEGLAARAG